jgi:hypothetical protein
VLLVDAAGDVEAEDAPSSDPRLGVEVDTGVEGDDGQALHRGAEVVADERGQPVGLAVEGEHDALDLLVVLELHLEQLDELDPHAGGAGHPDQRVGVGGVDLLDVTAGDQVAHGGPPVARHDDAVAVGQRDDGRRVGGEVGAQARRERTPAGQQVGRGRAQKVRERGRGRVGERRRKPSGWIKTRRHWSPLLT